MFAFARTTKLLTLHVLFSASLVGCDAATSSEEQANLSNSTPSFTSASTVSVAENTSGAFYTATANDDDGDTLTFSVIGGDDSGWFSINSTNGELSFVQPPNYEEPFDADANNMYSVILSVSDGQADTNMALEVNVMDENEGSNIAPVFTSSNSVEVMENTSDTFYTATANDDDGDTLTFSVIGGDDSGWFSINSTNGELSFVQPPNYEEPFDADANNMYSVILSVSDSQADTNMALEVNVMDENEGSNIAPVFTSSNSVEVMENTSDTFYTATANDDDGDTLTFSVIGGDDSGWFSINSTNGELSFVQPPNYEEPFDADANNMYSVILSVSDGQADTNMALEVNVMDENEGSNIAPVFTSSNSVEVMENTSDTFYTATANDDDGDTLTFSVIGGDDSGWFSINSTNGELSFVQPPNYEEPFDADANNMYSVILSVSDGQADTNMALEVNVMDENEGSNIAPVFTSSNSVEVMENTSDTFYTATANDDDGDTLTFSVIGGDDSGWFSINSTNGELSFVQPPNYEEPFDADANNMYSVILSVSDGQADTNMALEVNVMDENEGSNIAPVFTSSNSVEVMENTSDTFYTATANDDDGDTLTFSVIGGDDSGWFSINSTNGELSFVQPPNYEEPFDADANNMYSVILSVSDGQADTNMALEVNVMDENEGSNIAPVFTSSNSVEVMENTSDTFYTATANDDDGDTLTFSLTGGSDKESFAFDVSSGDLSFVSAPDFENPMDSDADNTYLVTLEVSDGQVSEYLVMSVVVLNEADELEELEPSVNLTSPSNGTFVNSSSITFEWAADNASSYDISVFVYPNLVDAVYISSGITNTNYEMELPDTESTNYCWNVTAYGYGEGAHVATDTWCFTMDTVPPSGSVIINNGENTTSTEIVVLELFASDASEVIEMYISIDGTFSDGDWEAFANTKQISYTEMSSYETATLTAYVIYKDIAGNISPPESDNILLSRNFVSGVFTSDQLWELSGSPYIVTGDIGIASNAVLTIEPGVIIDYDGPYTLLLKGGHIVANGTETEKITFQSQYNGDSSGDSASGVTMLKFEEVDLSNSQMSNIVMMNAFEAIRIGDESEHNQAPIKNTGELIINDIEVYSADITTDGYSTSASVTFNNAIFENVTVKGTYPRSEPIRIVNATVSDSSIRSDSYNQGIFIEDSFIYDSEIYIGCCGANISINNTVYSGGSVAEGGGSPVSGPLQVISSNLVNVSIDLYSVETLIRDTSFVYDNSYSLSTGLIIGSGSIEYSSFTGNDSISAVQITGYSGYSSTGAFSLTNSEVANNHVGIYLSGGSGLISINSSNIINSSGYAIQNHRSYDIDASSNYWGSSSIDDISARIYDGYDDLDYGFVDFTGYLPSLVENAGPR